MFRKNANSQPETSSENLGKKGAKIGASVSLLLSLPLIFGASLTLRRGSKADAARQLAMISGTVGACSLFGYTIGNVTNGINNSIDNRLKEQYTRVSKMKSNPAHADVNLLTVERNEVHSPSITKRHQ